MNRLIKVKLYSITIWLTFFIIAGQAMLPEDTWAKTIYVIPVRGTVDPGMAAFIERALSSERVSDPDALFVIDLDTF